MLCREAEGLAGGGSRKEEVREAGTTFFGHPSPGTACAQAGLTAARALQNSGPS